MAVIHETTISPAKLALLAAWLPGRRWYIGTGRAPGLVRVGGFRLDDPRGEVGIEFMAVTDNSPGGAMTYHVPMTYRGDAFDGIGGALIGTAEHGVLGRRWIYGGARGVARLARRCRGHAAWSATAGSPASGSARRPSR